MSEIHVFSVSELNRAAKATLEQALGNLWVRGEISNLAVASSGHAYFTLVDGTSEISAVRFRSRLPLPVTELTDGVEVLVYGRLTIYEPRGRYQLVVTAIQPAGLGAQQIAFEQLKAKLHQEGLFDPGHKLPLPTFPRRVGVVTSPTGAALRDIVSVLERRWPLVELILLPASVQGAGAAAEVVDALDRAVRFRVEGAPLDVVIVTRGGGSAEDLSPFNDERVARALHACSIPTISAVGHEIDLTIADLVADRRAPTPSSAAELLAPDREEIAAHALSVARSVAHRAHASLRSADERLHRHIQSYVLRVPLRRTELLDQRLDHSVGSLCRGLGGRWSETATALAAHAQTIDLSDPHRPLERGYSLTFVQGNASPLRDSTGVQRGATIETRLWRGKLGSEVKEVDQADVHR